MEDRPLSRRSVLTAGIAAGLFGPAALSMASEVSAPAMRLAAAGGAAPGFIGITQWLNSSPLTIESLRGKVVMVNFWTYGCYNCTNAMPHVTKLYEKYKSQGLVVVGIHTPEFPFEKSTGNVQTALKRHAITFPVAQDNDYATWKNYSNQYWPAQYIADKNGKIIYTHAGEGEYDVMDRTVQRLLTATS
jgi:thiol-disulfide isomerase/thioredoxin